MFDHVQWGEMALHIACRKGHDKVAKILLQAGADPNIQNMVSNLKRVTHPLLDTVIQSLLDTLQLTHACLVMFVFLHTYRRERWLYLKPVRMVMMK